MNCRFRVDDHIDLFIWDIEKEMRFDDFKALIHHRCGIYRDLGAHIPDRMIQCLFQSDIGELLSLQITERTSGSRQYKPADIFFRMALETLPDRDMFRIDRIELRSVFFQCGIDQIASGNQENALELLREILRDAAANRPAEPAQEPPAEPAGENPGLFPRPRYNGENKCNTAGGAASPLRGLRPDPWNLCRSSYRREAEPMLCRQTQRGGMLPA